MTRATRSISCRFALLSVAVISLIIGNSRAWAQASYTATGPGKYIAAGVTASAYEADYGKRLLGGGTVFVDANLTWRIGVEAEARTLRLHEDSYGTHQSTYLIGPRVSFHSRSFRPYAKFLVGRGEFYFPLGYAKGSYLVMAPGAGLDWRIHQSRLSIRVIDVQYQIWPSFNYGAPPPYPMLNPYGISSGINVKLF